MLPLFQQKSDAWRLRHHGEQPRQHRLQLHLRQHWQHLRRRKHQLQPPMRHSDCHPALALGREQKEQEQATRKSFARRRAMQKNQTEAQRRRRDGLLEMPEPPPQAAPQLSALELPSQRGKGAAAGAAGPAARLLQEASPQLVPLLSLLPLHPLPQAVIGRAARAWAWAGTGEAFQRLHQYPHPLPPPHSNPLACNHH